MYFQNVNGLRTKIPEFKQSLSNTCCDVIVLVETNLSPDISDSELGLQNFTIYRCDRSINTTSAKSSGGGVLIGVSSTLISQEIPMADCSIECIFVRIRLLGSSSLIVGAVYLPPNQSSQQYMDYCAICEEIFIGNASEQLLLMGDFNIPDVNWISRPLQASDGSSQMLIDLANLFHLQQMNRTINNRGVLLDLIFSSNSDTLVGSVLRTQSCLRKATIPLWK